MREQDKHVAVLGERQQVETYCRSESRQDFRFVGEASETLGEFHYW